MIPADFAFIFQYFFASGIEKLFTRTGRRLIIQPV